MTILGFVLWGRGLFCGWLCPFGAMQEFAHHIGRALRLPEIEAGPRLDQWLKKVKYIALSGLILTAFVVPDQAEKAAEIEPFKTAITVSFQREWFYVAYAALWLGLGTVFSKASVATSAHWARSWPSGALAHPEVDRTANRLRLALPVVQGQMPLRRDQEDRRNPV